MRTDVIGVVSRLVRRADAGLVRSAARNAAHGVRTEYSRELDDARTMRDLQKIPAASPTRAAERAALRA